ncbi:hypothetical protein [Pseudomonas sp. D2002]|nr:hypothetical protein [Pseudomonas sp. D2002]
MALAKKGAAKGGEEKARAERQDPRTHCRWAELEARLQIVGVT